MQTKSERYQCPFGLKSQQHPMIMLLQKKNSNIIDLANKMNGILNHRNKLWVLVERGRRNWIGIENSFHLFSGTASDQIAWSSCDLFLRMFCAIQLAYPSRNQFGIYFWQMPVNRQNPLICSTTSCAGSGLVRKAVPIHCHIIERITNWILGRITSLVPSIIDSACRNHWSLNEPGSICRRGWFPHLFDRFIADDQRSLLRPAAIAELHSPNTRRLSRQKCVEPVVLQLFTNHTGSTTTCNFAVLFCRCSASDQGKDKSNLRCNNIRIMDCLFHFSIW